MDKIAVLIPCYNEGLTIKRVVKEWHCALPEAKIYVYDNNSTDNTVEAAKAAGAIVRYEHAQGKGNVVRRMFREIDAECYLMVDGDDTYSADRAREMADAVLLDGVDMVIGDRLSSTYFEENTRRFHGMGNMLVRGCINHLFRSDVQDIMTGCRAFSYQFVKTFPVLSRKFEIETEMTVHAVDKNLSMKNVVIEYRDRPDGSESKLNTIPDGWRVLKTIMKLYRDYRPARFFGSIGLVLIGLALVFFIPVFREFLETGLVPQFPTLIVCGFSVLAGILAIFSGLILEVINIKAKQTFEFHLQMVRMNFINQKNMEDIKNGQK